MHAHTTGLIINNVVFQHVALNKMQMTLKSIFVFSISYNDEIWCRADLLRRPSSCFTTEADLLAVRVVKGKIYRRGRRRRKKKRETEVEERRRHMLRRCSEAGIRARESPPAELRLSPISRSVYKIWRVRRRKGDSHRLSDSKGKLLFKRSFLLSFFGRKWRFNDSGGFLDKGKG